MTSHAQAPQAPKSSEAVPLQHLIRTIDGVYTMDHSPDSWKQQWNNKFSGKKYAPSSKVMVKYTKNGKLHAIAEKDRVTIYDSKSLKTIQTIKQYDTEIIDFSPKGTYLLTYYRKMKSDRKPNMIIWEVASGNPARELFQKEYVLSKKPIIWSKDEDILVHLVTNKVNIYNGRKPSERLGVINMDGVSQIYLSPGSRDYRYIAIFVPEIKSSAAKIMVYKYPDLEKPTATKQFFKAQEAMLKWNYNGSALIAQTSTEISNNTYYGETGLHYMASDGSSNRTVTFGSNKGPVQATEWSPIKNEFIVIQGFQPAKIQLYNGRTCVPSASYGSASRNHIIWSPHGRFVCFGAFDNLGTGEMDFWDKNKFEKIGFCKDMDAPSYYKWTPDSRVLITAVLYPTRRSDNGYKAWNYCGDLLYHQKIEKIYQVAIQPASRSTYPDRPMSPRLSGRKIQKSQAQAPAKSYVPPHLRGRGVAASTALKTKASEAVKFGKSDAAKTAANKLKLQKRREKKRLQKAKIEEEKRQAQLKKEEERKVKEAAKEAARIKKEEERKLREKKEEDEALERLKNDDGAKAKQIKKIKKVLKAIRGLKEKESAGKRLDAKQRKKLESEASLREMLEKLRL